MNPVRILILAILVYLVILIIRGGRKKKKVQKTKPNLNKPQSVTDVLVEDPICSSLVPKEQSIKLEYEGDTIYFCSDECCKKFMKEKKLRS